MTRSRFLMAGLFLTLLVSQVPILLQLTLTPDAVLYDVQARCLLEGGVLYRDVLEPNLPGVVWIHAIVRIVAGWSPEALRVFDLIVVIAGCWLLVRLATSQSRRTPSSGLTATFSPGAGEKGHDVDHSLRDWNSAARRGFPDRSIDIRSGQSSLQSGILFLVLLTFYCSTSEWCHCQRDVWMLLPSLLAVTLRLRVLRTMATPMDGDRTGQRREGTNSAPNRIVPPSSGLTATFSPGAGEKGQNEASPSSGLTATFSPCKGEKGFCERLGKNGEESFAASPTEALSRWSKSILTMAVLEGILWAAAFWLKPFVAVPAIAVILASRRIAPSFRSWMLHSVAVISGGMIAGAAGILWMVESGCWPHFMDMLQGWNGVYFQSGRSRWTLERFAAHSVRFWPWILLHGPAIVISARGLFGRRTVGRSSPDETAADPRTETLLRALYLGWMVQAFLLQQMFDYIHVPGVLLAISVCGQRVSQILSASPVSQIDSAEHMNTPRRLIIATGVLLSFFAIVASPLLRPDRLKHWPECVLACFGAELSPTSKDELALSPFPRWSELQPMLDYVKAKQIPDRSLIAYNGNLIHLYPELSFRPSTRFVYLDVLARLFPDRRDQMTAEIAASGATWIVSDLVEDGWADELDDVEVVPEEISRKKATMFFPYNQTPVFRSGRYVLFRIDQPIGELTDQYFPLAIRLFPVSGGCKPSEETRALCRNWPAQSTVRRDVAVCMAGGVRILGGLTAPARRTRESKKTVIP